MFGNLLRRRQLIFYPLAIPDGRQSQFTFDSILFHDDPILRVTFHTCGGQQCRMGDFYAPLFHDRCFAFKLSPITPSFLAYTDYHYQPSSCEDRRRSNRIRRLLMPKLRDILPTRLPNEVLLIIAELLVQECAVITAQEQRSEHAASDSIIDLSCNIYAQYLTVDGVRYVKSLRDSKSEVDEAEQLLFDVQRMDMSTACKVAIARDHLGVRLVRILPLETVLPESVHVSGAWWRVISMPSGIKKIQVRTDVRGAPLLCLSRS